MGKDARKTEIPGRIPGVVETPTIEEGANTANTNSFIKKETKSKGAVLKQEVIAEALSGKGAGGPIDGVTSAASYGLKGASFSGDTGTILGNISGTPAMGKDTQGRTRTDKRLSDANKDINFIASEQAYVGYDNIPALADSKSTVGYNGNPKNVNARMQKKMGNSSAELLYDRSLDMITKDMFVFSTGQVVQQDQVDYKSYPDKTVDIKPGSTAEKTFSRVRGNYSPRNLMVKFKNDGGRIFVSEFKVETDDFSCNNENDVVVNKSATNHVIDLNTAELTRQTIDAKAGSPTSEHFNPLGRSVKEPTATVLYLQDMERANGAEIYTAIRFANKARGHYLNRTSKDGQDLITPALDALYGHLCGAPDSNSLGIALDDLEDTFFSRKGMAAGSAALMIQLFDSPRKYKTKADIVNQARGLKMHLPTAANNCGVFQAKSEFIKALNAIDCYSTIDHGYDPTMPVYITDNVRLIHPYDFAQTLGYTREGILADKQYTSDVFAYAYSAGSGNNRYKIICADPLLNGISWFMEQHAYDIFRALGGNINNNNAEVTLNVPTVHSTTHFSLWDYLICASLPYVVYERTNTMKDILDYQENYEYPFMGNVDLKTANPLACTNYGNIDPTMPIVVKELNPSTAMLWRFPEVVTPMGDYFLMPYYFNERSFDFTGETGLNNTLKDNGSCEFSTPVLRSGLKLAGLDAWFGLEVKDHLLISDRMTRLPGDASNSNVKGAIYKYSQDSDGLVALHRDYVSTKSAKDWCSTPRTLGWYFDAPLGLCKSIEVTMENGLPTETEFGPVYTAADVNLSTMHPSFTAIQYRGFYNSNEKPVDRPLSAGSYNVNRAQAFTQSYSLKYAGTDVKGRLFDLILSVNEAIEYNDELNTDPRFITLSDKAQFSPFVLGDYATKLQNGKYTETNSAYNIGAANRPIVFSPHAMYWALLQKTIFIVNPFENSDNNKPAADPFGIAYTFGLAGFISADYNEEIYNRANQYQYEGYSYIKDPMIEASPIFKASI